VKSSVLYSLLVLPLVQLLSLPANKSVSALQKLAADLLSQNSDDASLNQLSRKPVMSYSDVNSLSELYKAFCIEPAKLGMSLEALPLESYNTEQLCIVLCALTVRAVESVDSLKTLLSALANLTQHDPTLVSHILNDTTVLTDLLTHYRVPHCFHFSFTFSHLPASLTPNWPYFTLFQNWPLTSSPPLLW